MPGLVRLGVAERERTSLFSGDEIGGRGDAERQVRHALTTEQVARAYREASWTSWAGLIEAITRG